MISMLTRAGLTRRERANLHLTGSRLQQAGLDEVLLEGIAIACAVAALLLVVQHVQRHGQQLVAAQRADHFRDQIRRGVRDADAEADAG